MDRFTRSYLETALWSSTGDDEQPLDRDYCVEDIGKESTRQAEKVCALFQEEAADLLAKSGLSLERQGHLFWLNRNGHGCGFWEEYKNEWGGTGPALDKLCKKYNECYPYETGTGEVCIDDPYIWKLEEKKP